MDEQKPPCRVRSDFVIIQHAHPDVHWQTRIHRTRAWVQTLQPSPKKRKALAELDASPNRRPAISDAMDEQKKPRQPRQIDTQQRRLRSDTRGGQVVGRGEPSTAGSHDDNNDHVAALPQLSISSLPPLQPPISSSSKRSSSPRKPQATTEDLASHHPSIKFRSYQEAKKLGEITHAIRKLWLDVVSPAISKPAIPRAAKERMDQLYNTPEKSKHPPPKTSYSGSTIKHDGDDVKLMVDTLEDVLVQSMRWKYGTVHEATWSDLVISSLLHLTRRLNRFREGLTVLNITTVEIDPVTLCPTEKGSPDQPLNRKIDYIMGLHLDEKDRDYLEQHSFAGKRSINQTSGATRFTPVFLNIEVKRENVAVNPLVQLGVWVAAEYSKRVVEGYDRSMPVLAIHVVGNLWQLYMAYDPYWERKSLDKIVFLGPYSIGSTENIETMFRIMHVLTAVADWGISTYREWVQREMLGN